MRKHKGSTIMELLLVFAVLAAAVAFSVPVLQQLQTQRNADSEMDQAIALIRRAQVLSRMGEQDSEWGINIDANTITMFEGTSFSGRDSSFDEVITLANATSDVSSEFYFSKVAGLPSSTSTTVFTTTNNYEISLGVNEQGSIDYQVTADSNDPLPLL